MKTLVLDNYDSFVFNLVHIVKELGLSVDVFRNDKIDLEEVGNYDKIILSPGPGIPDEAGIMKDVIKTYGPTKSILGVCLGHQGIAEVFGARLVNIKNVLHGVKSLVKITDRSELMFDSLPDHFEAGHYHSWVIDPESVPKTIRVTAVNTDGLVMAIAHQVYDIRGVQFHPESIMTQYGKKMIENWVRI